MIALLFIQRLGINGKGKQFISPRGAEKLHQGYHEKRVEPSSWSA